MHHIFFIPRTYMFRSHKTIFRVPFVTEYISVNIFNTTQYTALIHIIVNTCILDLHILTLMYSATKGTLKMV
jgi:hypothetical protein